MEKGDYSTDNADPHIPTKTEPPPPYTADYNQQSNTNVFPTAPYAGAGTPPVMIQPGLQQTMTAQQQMMSAQMAAGMSLFSNHLNNIMESSSRHSGLLNVAPDVWMPKPEGGPVVPQGLEYLTTLDQLHIYQQVNIMASVTRSRASNYKILNAQEQLVYTANKQSSEVRTTLGSFGLGIRDANGTEIIRTGRNSKCCSGAPCCSCIHSNEFSVELPPGQIAGVISQGSSFSSVVYNVESGDGKLLFKLNCPACFLCGNCDANRGSQFQILSADSGQQVGLVRSLQQDIFQKALTNSGGFAVHFDVSLDAREKAIILACGFFIESNFYARSQYGRKNLRY